MQFAFHCQPLLIFSYSVLATHQLFSRTLSISILTDASDFICQEHFISFFKYLFTAITSTLGHNLKHLFYLTHGGTFFPINIQPVKLIQFVKCPFVVIFIINFNIGTISTFNISTYSNQVLFRIGHRLSGYNQDIFIVQLLLAQQLSATTMYLTGVKFHPRILSHRRPITLATHH